jgi:hypothetical protein
MTSRIAVALSVVAAVALPSCGLHEDTGSVAGDESSIVCVDVANVRERPSKLFCECNNIPGRDLVFDLTVTSRGEQRRTIYALLWFAANGVSPAEQAVWPQAAAQACVMIDGELAVTDHRTGAPFDVPGHGSDTRWAGAVVQPIGYYQGSLVGFDTVRVELWSEAGDCILEKVLDVKQPLREEPSDPLTKTKLNPQDAQELSPTPDGRERP